MDGPYPFGSPRTQRTLFKGGSVWRDQALFDDSWGEVILMCGLPGTGKDAWIRASCPGLPVVSLDDVRLELDVTPTQSQGQVVQAARERARALLRQRQPFVWNATSLTALRAQQVGLFEDAWNYGRRIYEDIRAEQGQNSYDAANIAFAVASSYFNGLRERESVEWYRIAAEEMEKSIGEPTGDMANAWNKYARCFTWDFMQDFDRA